MSEISSWRPGPTQPLTEFGTTPNQYQRQSNAEFEERNPKAYGVLRSERNKSEE